MTPLDVMTFVFVTCASPTYTLPEATRIGTEVPSSVFADFSLATCEAVTSPLTTWYRSTALSFMGFFPSSASAAFGTAAKAASVGANTVSGPGPDNAPTRPACLTSETSVLNLPAATAVWTMFDWAGAAALLDAAEAEEADAAVLELEDELPHAASVAANATPASVVVKNFFIGIELLVGTSRDHQFVA